MRGYFPLPRPLLAGVVGAGVVLSGAGDFRPDAAFPIGFFWDAGLRRGGSCRKDSNKAVRSGSHPSSSSRRFVVLLGQTRIVPQRGMDGQGRQKTWDGRYL